MADDDVPIGGSESTGGQGDQPTTKEVESGEREDPTPPESKPEEEKPSEEDPAKTKIESFNSINEQLNKMYKEASERETEMRTKISGAVNDLQKLINQPAPAPPQAVTMPPPMSEQHKGGVAEFVTNLLKFGALAALAFGAGRRGAGHSAIAKSALGAALSGYAEGRKDVRDSAMHLWEKNREVVNDYNREQNANYRAILQDRRMNLTQKMDMINALSAEYKDYRTWDASRRQDLTALQKNINDQMRLQRDHEKWVIQHRHKINDAIGKEGHDGRYFAWVYQKSGIQMDANWTADQYYDFGKAHPELQMSEFIKYEKDEEIKKVREKAEAGARGREAATQPEKAPADPEAEKKAAKILEGLVQ
jgi:hypothetical protein